VFPCDVASQHADGVRLVRQFKNDWRLYGRDTMMRLQTLAKRLEPLGLRLETHLL